MTLRVKRRDFDTQLMQSIRNVRTSREPAADTAYRLAHREDWLDSMMYGMLFGTPDEIYRTQCRAAREAELEGRPYTPVFWHGGLGAEPVLTLWRIE